MQDQGCQWTRKHREASNIGVGKSSAGSAVMKLRVLVGTTIKRDAFTVMALGFREPVRFQEATSFHGEHSCFERSLSEADKDVLLEVYAPWYREPRAAESPASTLPARARPRSGVGTARS